MRTTLLALTLAVLAAAAPRPLLAEACTEEWAACYWEATHGPGADWDVWSCDVDFLSCTLRAISAS